MNKEQEIRNYIRSFIPMVDFLAEILGKTSEVVLNDLTDLDHSVIAIRNAEVSKRKIGDPATNLALRTMQAGKKEKDQFLANYEGVSRGGHNLRSSTFFIRYQGELVAMICINTDDSIFDKLKGLVDKIVVDYKHLETKDNSLTVNLSTVAGREKLVATKVEPERLTSNISELAKSEVIKICEQKNISVNYLKREDKLEVVRSLFNQGYFLLKDSVGEVAEILKVSEPTIYRYLQIVKVEAKGSGK
ncbi:helix-turn-helix transcriptional regulator [Liquorilactobacillus capillatus]|uniref:Uncharacterized protein n=1 Tax=Liquorilactobacillus capillatus DSM 19910 TaxID=1423731 RepID=A0A0R1M7Y4_9LACO|nr:PAS domain-containing protein [Liquorilactobacillus capillatus]KRL01010.1 hypothetical protein FC81_GL001612 [Liquorilactobacillus capillatus DSM 19910]